MRANLDREEFSRLLSPQGVSGEVASLTWELLSDYCGANILPHPSDDLSQFYGLDGDELGDLIEEAFERLSLPRPSAERPEVAPDIPSAADLCLYLEARRRDLAVPIA
jgi:hypothetical protein